MHIYIHIYLYLRYYIYIPPSTPASPSTPPDSPLDELEEVSVCSSADSIPPSRQDFVLPLKSLLLFRLATRPAMTRSLVLFLYTYINIYRAGHEYMHVYIYIYIYVLQYRAAYGQPRHRAGERNKSRKHWPNFIKKLFKPNNSTKHLPPRPSGRALGSSGRLLEGSWRILGGLLRGSRGYLVPERPRHFQKEPP